MNMGSDLHVSPSALPYNDQGPRGHPANAETVNHSTSQPFLFPTKNLTSSNPSSFTHKPTSLLQNLNMVAQTAAFKKAVEDSRKLKAKPTNDELLEVPGPLSYCVLLYERNWHTLTVWSLPALRKLQARHW